MIMLLRAFLLATLCGQVFGNDAATVVPDPGFWYSSEGSESYFEARNKCRWSAPVTAHNFWGDSFLYTDSSAWTKYWHDAGRDKLLVRECHTPDVDREGNIWVIRRVGPFNTTGGAKEGKWHGIKFHEPIQKRWLTGRFAARVDAEGTMFPSPPLHVHHEHFSYGENLPDYVRASSDIFGTYKANRIFAMHGDNYFMDADGGVIGNAYKSYPEGYGKRMENVYYHDNKIGDIRPPNSPVLQWWTEVAYRYTVEEPKRELLHMSRFNLANFFENVHIHVPSDTPSIFWQSWKMPADGEFETNWCHTHGAEHIIIFKGDPSKFALGKKYSKRNPWFPKPVDNVDDVANDLIQSATEVGIGYCEGKIQWEGEEIRMTQFNCNPWKFKKGDTAAIVTLYDPVHRPYTNLRQHFIFRGDWVPDDPSIVDRNREELLFKNLQFCGENADQCLDQITLGYKIYMVIVNFGWMQEYSVTKNSIGWLILMASVALVLIGFYRLLNYMCNKFSQKFVGYLPQWKLVNAHRKTYKDSIPVTELDEKLCQPDGLRSRRSSMVGEVTTTVLLSDIE